jgi:glycosyltransferase involved in cell wall biosynthesis
MTFRSGKRRSEQAPVPGGKSIVVVGPFQPPVHGFAKATTEIASLFETAGYSVARIDVKPVPEPAGVFTSLWVRARQIAEAGARIRRGAELYLALSGGRRQAIDLLFLLIGRICGAKIYLHHHSFAYLSNPSRLANLCFRICGMSTTHLVLCTRMKSALTKLYPAVGRTEVVSNSALLGEGFTFRQRTKVSTLGFLGALTAEKGVLEFLQVAAKLAPEHPELKFRIAGPCHDDAVLSKVNAACQNLANLEYVGPVYGEPKFEFFASLDALLFLSTYCNEAEPFVIWEAQASGIPVIASARGCMEEMLRLEAHQDAIVPSHQSLVDLTIQTIEKWLADPETFAKRSTDVYLRYQAASIAARRRFELIFNLQPETSLKDAEIPMRQPVLIQIEKRPV